MVIGSAADHASTARPLVARLDLDEQCLSLPMKTKLQFVLTVSSSLISYATERSTRVAAICCSRLRSSLHSRVMLISSMVAAQRDHLPRFCLILDVRGAVNLLYLLTMSDRMPPGASGTTTGLPVTAPE